MIGILAAAAILALITGVYVYILIRRIMKYTGFSSAAKAGRITAAALAFTIVCLSFNLKTPLLIYLLHFLLFTLIVNLIFLAVNHFVKFNKDSKCSRILMIIKTFCIIPALLTIAVSIFARTNMNRITRTEYNIYTDKTSQDYKILLLSDFHWATIQDTDVFINTIDKINSENADVIILDGDITDERTSRKEMYRIFKLLGSLNSKYGIYYVYGNHDRQLYSGNPAFTREELDLAIADSGIQILQDYGKLITKELVIAGREDASMNRFEKRQEISEILQGFSRDSFIIVADHQPKNADEVKESGADLLVSGHTHGGQIFPAGRIMDALGAFTYGKYSDGDFSVIVTSGIAGWGYSFRTERQCEYVVINIKSGKN
ncbi:metallophosphoesterase [Treponema sp.]|uniref:metallophosphoesterase n=1 Tax=Treponema sp. TaxID=166 RepID=UPI0025F1415A|nr:metallophosphoesterase [Treponema sp.]MCR5218632.1 metallophosphoesterase [Treponema sp.]